MSTHQGARPDHPEDEEMLADSDLTMNDIGQSLILLGEQLREVGNIAYQPTTRDDVERHFYGRQHDHDDSIESVVLSDLAFAAEQERIARTLTALRNFRRSYYYWERIAVEHALNEGKFSQRRVAALLGIGVNTVNRWANNPVATEDES